MVSPSPAGCQNVGNQWMLLLLWNTWSADVLSRLASTGLAVNHPKNGIHGTILIQFGSQSQKKSPKSGILRHNPEPNLGSDYYGPAPFGLSDPPPHHTQGCPRIARPPSESVSDPSRLPGQGMWDNMEQKESWKLSIQKWGWCKHKMVTHLKKRCVSTRVTFISYLRKGNDIMNHTTSHLKPPTRWWGFKKPSKTMCGFQTWSESRNQSPNCLLDGSNCFKIRALGLRLKHVNLSVMVLQPPDWSIAQELGGYSHSWKTSCKTHKENCP